MSSANVIVDRKPRPRFSGKKQWFVVLLLLLALPLVYFALYPWAFFMGGSFHILPYWTGWGRMHSKTAGDYFLYVEILPFTSNTNHVLSHTNVQGKAKTRKRSAARDA